MVYGEHGGVIEGDEELAFAGGDALGVGEAAKPQEDSGASAVHSRVDAATGRGDLQFPVDFSGLGVEGVDLAAGGDKHQAIIDDGSDARSCAIIEFVGNPSGAEIFHRASVDLGERGIAAVADVAGGLGPIFPGGRLSVVLGGAEERESAQR